MKVHATGVQLFAVFAMTTLAAATDPTVIDQNEDRLVPVSNVVPIATILDDYGTSSSESDPSLPAFLEGVLDLASEELRNGAEIVVFDTSIKSSFDENENLVEQELDVAAYLGLTEIEIELNSRVEGEFRVHVTLFSEGNPPSYVDATFRIYLPESLEAAQVVVIALPGTCKCSKAGATGCTDAKCRDGDTCPGNNGHSCGFYTRSV
ncbi:MAG: hypothetical protein HZA51_03965 [Planctomycetes bacterium]|nr:hypothetical protein [Planctomycetota bacterium]